MVPKDHAAVGSEETGAAMQAAPEMGLALDRDFGALFAAVPAARDGTAPALYDVLSEILFGEIIDISDLIPRFLPPAAEATNSEVLSETSTGLLSSASEDVLLVPGQSAMTILYDDGILSTDGVVL